MNNAEKNNKKIYVYRYMWLSQDSENLNIKVLSGIAEEHEKFIEALKNDSNIEKACRVYLHEIDISLIEYYDTVKEEKKEKEGE